MRKWLQDPRNDSAEYKMWGNSLAIPNAYHVLAGIAEEMLAEPSCDVKHSRIKAHEPPMANNQQPEYEQLTIFDYLDNINGQTN